MVISKNISVGILDVDPDAGKIWLNGPNCILRVQDLEFKNKEEKFCMIDINGRVVTMYPGSNISEPYADFLEKLNLMIMSNLNFFYKHETERTLNRVLESTRVIIGERNVTS
jgi:hypothetical protein